MEPPSLENKESALTRTVKGELSDVEKLRFDYAWKWFSFHAEQRTKMFNYMLLGLGIFATAVVSALNNGLVLEATVISVAAAVLGGAFILLDRRNKQLYVPAMDVLIQMEMAQLFRKGEEPKDLKDGFYWGISGRIRQEDQKTKNFFIHFFQGRHRILMPAVTLLFVVLFIIIATESFSQWHSKTKDQSLRCSMSVPAPKRDNPAQDKTEVAIGLVCTLSKL
jgi:hypothetical protein